MASGLASGSKEIVTCKGALPGNWQGFFVDEVRLWRVSYPETE